MKSDEIPREQILTKGDDILTRYVQHIHRGTDQRRLLRENQSIDIK